MNDTRSMPRAERQSGEPLLFALQEELDTLYSEAPSLGDLWLAAATSMVVAVLGVTAGITGLVKGAALVIAMVWFAGLGGFFAGIAFSRWRMIRRWKVWRTAHTIDLSPRSGHPGQGDLTEALPEMADAGANG